MSVFPISVTITSAGLTLKEKSKGGLFTKVSPGGIYTYIYTVLGGGNGVQDC